MTHKEQMIAIAKTCAWKKETHIDPCGDGWETTPPNYLNDLNAMHEAEKTLTDKQYEDYRQELWFLCELQDIRATAAQRAEAFLRTLNLWKD